MGKSVEILRVK